MKIGRIFSIIIFSLMVFSFTESSYAGGVGTYSHGYRFGMIDKFSIKGRIIESGEGTMLLGVDSTPYKTSKGEVVNPWAFSSPKSNKEINNQLDSHNGDYTVIEYKQYHKKMPNVDTDYEVIGVYDISTEKVTEPCTIKDFEEVWGDGSPTLTQKSKGKRTGRFVKASEKGMTINSNEVTIQQGNAGNEFSALSIRDNAIYECAIRYLKAGQKAKIYYIESMKNLDITGRETDYDVVKIEPLTTKFE